ncbi:MAG: MarR family transcriptional regulator [Chitinophagaceae bacterium]|nr:MarR family transcriptional regulator [Chitinophagaceae bacterium]
MPEQRLEQLIKLNHPFINQNYKGVVGIIVLESFIFQDLENHLSQYKLTYQQFNILRILKGQHPNGVQLSVLKERMLHKNSDVSRLVDRLVAMNLVEKPPNEFNKRKLHIQLTEEGLNLISTIDIGHPAFQSIMSALDDEEILLFNKLVNKVIDQKLLHQKK